MRQLLKTVEIEVSFNQFGVFAGSLRDPFNDWSDAQFGQGFSWRPGSVFFRTMMETGLHRLAIFTCEMFPPIETKALRAIEVPFEVPGDNRLEVASVADGAEFSLPPGTCMLRCQFLGGQDQCDDAWLEFATAEPPRFRIVRQDADLDPPDALQTSGRPATGV